MSSALVLDFGGPVLRTPFELLRGGEARSGLAPETLDWWGPFAPERDERWRRMQAGEMTERAYWLGNAEQFADLTGADPTFRGLMDVLFDAPEDDLVRPEAVELVREATAAGLAVAVCTNDMQDFHGEQWVRDNRFLRLVDVLVDGSVEKVLKPDPRIYRTVVDRLGVDASECLFVDDQPGNCAGAEAVGMTALRFDVTDPSASYAEARRLLGLPSPVR